jgi:membrane-bound lytic murein transglycosylase MltF
MGAGVTPARPSIGDRVANHNDHVPYRGRKPLAPGVVVAMHVEAEDLWFAIVRQWVPTQRSHQWVMFNSIAWECGTWKPAKELSPGARRLVLLTARTALLEEIERINVELRGCSRKTKRSRS